MRCLLAAAAAGGTRHQCDEHQSAQCCPQSDAHVSGDICVLHRYVAATADQRVLAELRKSCGGRQYIKLHEISRPVRRVSAPRHLRFHVATVSQRSHSGISPFCRVQKILALLFLQQSPAVVTINLRDTHYVTCTQVIAVSILKSNKRSRALDAASVELPIRPFLKMNLIEDGVTSLHKLLL